jgi:hypothetical protein
VGCGSMLTEEDFRQAVTQVQSAIQRGCTEDPEPFKALYSHADDVTIMGAWSTCLASSSSLHNSLFSFSKAAILSELHGLNTTMSATTGKLRNMIARQYTPYPSRHYAMGRAKPSGVF